MTDDRYDRVKFRGWDFDKLTVAFILAMEGKLGYELTILQDSYNPGGVGASAGTHDGGGAIDFAPWHYEDKVLAGRQLGAAIWHRTALPGVWGEHIHCEVLGDAMASDQAKAQWSDYKAGRNGLADHGPDNGPRLDPLPIYFHYNYKDVKVPPPGDPKPPPPPHDPGHYAQILEVQQSLAAAIHGYDAFKKNFPAQHFMDSAATEWRKDWAMIHAANPPA